MPEGSFYTRIPAGFIEKKGRMEYSNFYIFAVKTPRRKA